MLETNNSLVVAGAASRPRIGEGHRRAPGDVVAGAHPTAGDIIGRVVFVGDGNDGYIVVELDNGKRLGFQGRPAALLKTIQEVDAPFSRGGYGWILDTVVSA